MSKYNFKLLIPTALATMGAWCFPAPADAAIESQVQEAPLLDQCTKELLLSYFPEQFVNETLKKFNIPEDKWASINKALSGKEKEIIKTVEEKASQMNPNPLKDPQQRQAAVKLFRETLLQLFSDILKSNGVKDDGQFHAMLEDIQHQKARKFAECMKKQDIQNKQTSALNKPVNQTSSSSIKTTDNDDDDDDDEDDDDDDDDDDDQNDHPSMKGSYNRR